MKNFAPLALLVLISTNAFALNPSRTYKQRPEKFNMKYTETKVKTNDGKATLNVWDFPCKTKTTETILVMHNGEGNMADYLRRVDQLKSMFNVVIFDYRGYGESSEFEIDDNMYIYPHFQDDVKTMFDHVRKTKTSTFHVYGWGVGGGLALGIGWNRTETKTIVADTPFLSIEDLEDRFSSWDEPMEVPFAGYEKKFEPIYSIENKPAKNLKKVKLIVGSSDKLFKSTDYAALIKAQKKFIDKEVMVIQNPDQKDNFRVNKSEYFSSCKQVWFSK